MRFERSDEQRAIAETARELLAARSGEGLWSELCELGWPGIAIGEEYGGQGLGVLELAILVEELGYACAEVPLLGTTLAGLALESAGSEEQRQRHLGEIASGASLAAFGIAGRSELIPDAAPDRLLVLAAPDLTGASLFPRGGVEPAAAIDPRRDHGRPLAGADGEDLPGAIGPSLDRAAAVVAAELVGLCRRALEETLAYVKERHQFGVPVGSFQAVQHNAAQMLRDTECAAVCTMQAAWLADNEPESLPPAARMAKGAASAAGRTVTAAAIQLHGGIGFTWEANLHWLFKRAQVDAAYLGASATHYAALARSAAA